MIEVLPKIEDRRQDSQHPTADQKQAAAVALVQEQAADGHQRHDRVVAGDREQRQGRDPAQEPAFRAFVGERGGEQGAGLQQQPQLSVIGTKLVSRTGGARMQTQVTAALSQGEKRRRRKANSASASSR